MSLTIHLATALTEEVRALVSELEETLAAEYPPEQRHGLSLEAIFAPHVRFYVARQDGEAVGCGGVAFFPDYAEVKRMYVRPAARGTGVAPALLTRIEATALEEGLPTLRLETGARQAAALAMYRRAGFEPCPPFGEYAMMDAQAIATSVFMEKRLEME
jgi:putative acetyltransferase